MISETERVIAGGGSDDSPLSLLGRKKQQSVSRASLLERTSALQGFGLEEHARSGERIEYRGGHQRRAQRYACKPLRGGIDISGGWQVGLVLGLSRTKRRTLEPWGGRRRTAHRHRWWAQGPNPPEGA